MKEKQNQQEIRCPKCNNRLCDKNNGNFEFKHKGKNIHIVFPFALFKCRNKKCETFWILDPFSSEIKALNLDYLSERTSAMDKTESLV